MANDAPLLLDATRLIWRRWAGREPTGIDRVCLAYLEHFGPRSQAVVQHRYFRKILDRQASAALFDLLKARPKRFRMALLQGIVRYGRSASRCGNGRLYLNIGHTGLDSDDFRRWLAAADVQPVYFVHDLIPITHPQFCRPGESARHRERMRTALSTGAGVVANSQATVDELREFAVREALPCPPALAAWLGSPRLKAPKAAVTDPDRPTFVTVGTIEARKNHLMLLRIWERLVDRLGDSAPRLLIIGQRGWEAKDAFTILDSNDRLRGHVTEIRDCSDRDLARHLVTAGALLFPSCAEGFGLPLVEALGLGVPVIASDLPAFREIGQGVPTFLNPNDADAWESAILDFARPESAARVEQLRRLPQFQIPDWENHFRSVEQWLGQLDRRAGGSPSNQSAF